jgi:cell division protein FtsN
LLQVGAFPNRALADEAFDKFMVRYGSAVGIVSPNIQEADLGEKGVWYRLRIGPFADKAAANAACDAIKAQGGSCFAATP